MAAASPFELLPARGCQSNTETKGILLIHGLSDMPFAMRDLSKAFAERCFLVRTILLPGHGTRAGDLLNIERADWLAATRFALSSLKSDVDEVYIGGFSLGGLLSTLVAMDDADIKAIFAFSPAFALKREWQLKQALWLRYIIDWADTDDPDDYARYEAMPINGLAETYLLTTELKQKLQRMSLDVPVFLAQSADDSIIDVEINNIYFNTRFVSPLSQSVVYSKTPLIGEEISDLRVKQINSYLPEQRIVGFSHQSVHIDPNNAHYGAQGVYRNCGANTDRDSAAAARCLNAEQLWWSELFSEWIVLFYGC